MKPLTREFMADDPIINWHTHFLHACSFSCRICTCLAQPGFYVGEWQVGGPQQIPSDLVPTDLNVSNISVAIFREHKMLQAPPNNTLGLPHTSLCHGRNIHMGLSLHTDMHILPAHGRTPQRSLLFCQLACPPSVPAPVHLTGVAGSRGYLLSRSLPPV